MSPRIGDMISHSRNPLALLCVSAIAVACGTSREVDPAGVRPHTAAVIDGQTDPSVLGFTLTAEEQNAIVAQVVEDEGDTYQGCTGNVVDDRIVIAAAHCVVTNQSAWLHGAEPELAPASMLKYHVGPDIGAPLCQLAVREVHIHPECSIDDDDWIQNDVSVMVFANSVAETCPQLTPFEMNREALSNSLRGTEMLQGGYGSLDESYDFSPVRHWSKLEYYGTITSTPNNVAWLDSMGSGDPSFGDSGSGILRRDTEGDLQILGVLSFTAESAEGLIHGFSRVDTATAFIDSVADTIAVCDTVPAGGLCSGATVLACDEQGLRSIDCSAEGKVCEVVNGVAACITSPTEVSDEEEDGCNTAGRSDPLLATLWLLPIALRVRTWRLRQRVVE